MRKAGPGKDLAAFTVNPRQVSALGGEMAFHIEPLVGPAKAKY